MTDCLHLKVLVDYWHPQGDQRGVGIADLKASDPKTTRESMHLAKPRCADCGRPLTKKSLGPRIQRGGDLYDRRFSWS